MELVPQTDCRMNMNMKKIYSFPRGGFVFEDSYAPELSSIETAFLPVLSVIPLLQHRGSKAQPIVYVGEYVKEGMLVGRAQSEGAVNVHATVPGKVVRTASWKNVDGIAHEALVIRMEGSFEKLGKPETVFQWDDEQPLELQRLIAEYGVVEMDRGGRAVSELLGDLALSKEPVTLVARCVFDDPWLTAERAVCAERLKAVVEGVLIAAKACGAKRIVYAVSCKEKQLASSLQHTMNTIQSRHPKQLPYSVVTVGNRYPQHNGRELELVLREYEKKETVPLGRLFMISPSTLSALYDAVVFHKPILDRYVAVGGSAVKSPKVIKTRIGSRLRDLFEQCGGFSSEPSRVIIGSPLSGRAVRDLDEPVTKTSYAAVAMLDKEVGGTVTRSCVCCGECREVCPVGLDPEDLYKRILANPEAPPLSECHGCGCCELICPSRLPLSTTIRASGKGGLT
jgi:electron transport complex protein RnfC